MIIYVYKVYGIGRDDKMKKATNEILKMFPNFKKHVLAYENMLMTHDALKDLDDVQSTFLKLIWFFEDPKQESFDIRLLYLHLDNDWLEFALKLITEYFREDTYLIREPSFSLVTDDSEYFSLTQFADYLTEHGFRYDRQKMNLYYTRGVVPKPDIVIGGVKYWNLKTVENYKAKEKNRCKKKDEEKGEGINVQ